jgi:hypothetical protein
MSKLTDISEVRTASIITLMMEAVCTSETSVNFDVTTRRYSPEDSKLQVYFWPFTAKLGNMTHPYA